MHSSTSTARVGVDRQAIELVGALALTLLIFSYGARASLDDLLIYLRYVANILGGNGPVYNAGEPSAGATSFGWLAIMSVVARLFGNTELVWKGTGAAFILIGLLMFAWRLRALPAASALAILLFTLLDPFAIRWFGSGMENGLVYAGVAACLLAFECFLQAPSRSRAVMVCAASAALPFVRPEFLALSGSVSLFVAFSQRRPYFWIVVCEAVAIAVVAFCFYMWIGFAFPQTGVAKALMLAQADPFYAPVTMIKYAAVAVPGVVVVTIARFSSVRRLYPLFVAVGVLWLSVFAYFTFTRTLISTRYTVVYSAPLLCAGALGLAHELRTQGRWSIGMRLALGVQLLACGVGLVWQWPATRIDEVGDIRPIGEWAKQNLPAGSKVALTEVGAFGFYYGGKIVDLVGLVSPAVVEYARQHGPSRSLAELEPLLVSTHATYYLETFGAKEPIRGGSFRFVPLKEWRVRRNNLSHGRDVAPDTWRLYALQSGSAAAKPADSR
ncbi:MAG TPA: hypothetical protein VKY24_06495 [Reyranella sp.]|nr:hypothetical protein [Reyranella sp.]